MLQGPQALKGRRELQAQKELLEPPGPLVQPELLVRLVRLAPLANPANLAKMGTRASSHHSGSVMLETVRWVRFDANNIAWGGALATSV